MHMCVVCNNVYSSIADLERHQKERGHIGGHFQSIGPLKRQQRSGMDADEEDEAPALLGDGDDDPEDGDDLNAFEKDPDKDERAPPMLQRDTTREKPR